MSHRLARVIVALRRDGRIEAIDDLAEGDLDAVVGTLPVGWLVLLAVALVAADRDEGTHLVRSLGPAARGALYRIEESGSPLSRTARRLLNVVPPAPRHALRLEVLGGLRLVRDGVEVDDANLRRARVRQLLGYLVLRGQASRQQLTAHLWPDLDESDAARNLRVTLNYVQRALEPNRDERDAPFFLRAKASRLELVEDPALEVDLRTFENDLDEALRAEAQGAPSLALAAYLRATDHYGGDLLAGTEADSWLELERDRLRRRYLRAVLRAGQSAAGLGRSPPAPRTSPCRALIVGRALSEEAYPVLIAALVGQGERACRPARPGPAVRHARPTLDVPAPRPRLELARQLRNGAVTGSA